MYVHVFYTALIMSDDQGHANRQSNGFEINSGRSLSVCANNRDRPIPVIREVTVA